MIHTYRARRRLQMQPGVWREPLDADGPGDLVPEAHTWFRVDSWLHTGYLEEADVTEDEFRDAVAEFCPDIEDRVLELAGVTAALEGTHKTPRPLEVTVTKRAPAKKAPAKKAPAKKA